MRTTTPLSVLLAAALAAALAGCANRVIRGESAPLAPPTDVDRAGDAPTTRAEVAGLPAWLSIRLADFDAQSRPAAPQAVYQVRYGNETAYLVKAGCCDQLDPLIDARGVLVCYPSGGFTGRGDGKCPGALPPEGERREVWRHR